MKEFRLPLDIKSLDIISQEYDNKGNIRVCTRGGVLLGFVKQEEYKEYLASDTSQEQDNKDEG